MAGGAAAAAAGLVGSRVAIAGYARDSAVQSALAVAAYLSLATRTSADGSDYDLGQLLIRARALQTLPDWAPEIEIYHPTAPLVHATAPPLAPSELRQIRDDPSVRWRRGVALAPLRVPHEDDIVGAVEVRAPPLGPVWPGGWGVPAFLLMLWLGARTARALQRGREAARDACRWYWAGGLLLGIAAYADVRTAAHQAAERWLSDTRALVQEAARIPERPGLDALAPLARGGILVAADSGGDRVHLGAGRWAELQAGTTGGDSARWLLWTLGLSLVGPALAWAALGTTPNPGEPAETA